MSKNFYFSKFFTLPLKFRIIIIIANEDFILNKKNKSEEKIFSRPPFFPMMIDIKNKDVLIIGGGRVASRRAETLSRCGAKITAVSKKFLNEFPDDAVKIERAFSPEDIDEKFLFVIAATDDREINELVHKISSEKKIPVNVCDCQDECDFFFPSLINYGSVAASVCTAGENVSLAKKISDKLRRVWTAWLLEEL